MIIKKEIINDIITYTVKKNIDDNEMNIRLNKFVSKKDIDIIIDHSCDVYTEENKLLLRFRKNVLTQKNTNLFFENVNSFAHNTSSNRGSTTGAETKKKNVLNNPHVMSNIFGFFDKLNVIPLT